MDQEIFFLFKLDRMALFVYLRYLRAATYINLITSYCPREIDGGTGCGSIERLAEHRGFEGTDGRDPRKVPLPHAQLQKADD